MHHILYSKISSFVRKGFLLLYFLSACIIVCAQDISISGKIVNENGEPVPGATVTIKGISAGTATDDRGEFTLPPVKKDAILVISSVGYEKQELSLNGRSHLIITLKKKTGELDQAIVIAYGTTTKRLNTGDVSKVTAEEIERQPVSNPLAALEGRVPGLIVTQSNGVPGSGFKVQIRGQNSIAQGSDPLFIIDGVPFAPNNSSVTQMISAATPNGTTLGLSPLNSINPNDIESIEVLKDADATAIYGSRGANGVILITTKQGKAGRTKFDINVYTGESRVTRTMDMLNTQQYLQMRREAFYNDGVVPTTSNASDLLVWDTTRYTDFKKLLIGGTAHTTDAQASISGGNTNTQFLIGGGYHHETTVFPGNMADGRGSMHLNLHNNSDNGKFSATLSAIYSADKNNLIANSLAGSIALPPDAPALFDKEGHLNWQEGGVSFINPLAYLLRKYTAQTENSSSNLVLSYKLASGLTIKSSAGYNTLQVSEVSLLPAASQNPAYNPSGYSEFGNSGVKSWILEPQIEYRNNIGKGKLNLLVGATWQQNFSSSSDIAANGYTNDALLQSLNGAGSTSATNGSSQYRYAALFGRVNYNWQDKYVLNLSGRRDGSSRFGPGRRFSDFGAAAAAWIFSNENFIKTRVPFISYGKFRASYGSSGNDQIGNYQYLDTWSNTYYPYQGTPGLTPTSLFNPDYSWEVNRKLEGAIELGFFKDHFLLSGAYYRNRSSNQLIQYNLPTQTGFNSIIENFPALVQNTGLELSLTSNNLTIGSFSWTSSFSLTIPRNKLVSFPNIATSSYSYKYVVGKSLNVYGGFHFLGVNPNTGIYQFADQNGKATSSPSTTTDWHKSLGNLDLKFYGGFDNNLVYKKWQLDIFFEFRKQTGKNYMASFSNTPGSKHNQPSVVLQHWQKPGDVTSIQQFTQSYGDAFYGQYYLGSSDGIYSDASFIRLKNAYLSYTLPSSQLEFLHIETVRIYLQGQNLLTITNYLGSDPETQSFYVLPPLKTLTAGIQFTF